MTTGFRHISAYYQVMSNCETVSLLQFYKFIIKCWQWCLKGNKLMRLNELPWNEPEIFRILSNTYKGAELMFLLSDGLSLIIRRLSLISNKNFLFSCAKMLKLPKEGVLDWFNLNISGSFHGSLFNLISFFPAKHHCQHLIINL